MKNLFLFISILIFTCVPLFAQNTEFVEDCNINTEGGCIDWNKGIAIATGNGVPAKFAKNMAAKNASAKRAARLDAARNLLELIKGINISSSSTMKQAMITDDTVRTSIAGKLNGLRRVGKVKYYNDGSIKVVMEARLDKIIPKAISLKEVKEIATPLPIPVPKTKAAIAIPTKQISLNQAYTGLIIDATGLGVEPAMSPKVYDEDGNEVYGSAYVERKFAVKFGMAGYQKSVAKAKNNDRVKGNPLVIKAVKNSGANGADVVISNENAAALRQLSKSLKFLAQAKVVIVL